jgi:hypothetical protein
LKAFETLRPAGHVAIRSFHAQELCGVRIFFQFEKWHGRPARENTRKMRVPPQNRVKNLLSRDANLI